MGDCERDEKESGWYFNIVAEVHRIADIDAQKKKKSVRENEEKEYKEMLKR